NFDGKGAGKKRSRIWRQRRALIDACARVYGLEFLESRVMLAADFWTGGAGVNTNWSAGANWLRGAAPRPGDDLVFPVSNTVNGVTTLVTQFTATDDFNAGTQFNSINIKAGGYSLTG